MRRRIASRFLLTPGYDVISAYPAFGNSSTQLAPKKVKMAMALEGRNRHYMWYQHQRHYWNSTAQLCGFDAQIDDLIDEIVAAMPAAIAQVQAQIQRGFPMAIAEAIFDGMHAFAGRLAKGK